MKIRNGFITNSSSTCFIVSFNTQKSFDEETLVKYPFLKHYGDIMKKVFPSRIENDYYNSVELYEIENLEEWEAYVRQENYLNDTNEPIEKKLNTYWRRIYRKGKKEIESGKGIACVVLPNYADNEINHLKDLKKKKLITIIEEYED